MIKGFDTIARLTAEQAVTMRSLGYEFAIRYCVPNNSKSITAAEADDLLSAGLAVGLCWETTAARAKSGAAGGLTDGRMAKEYAAGIGAPEGTVIYFAVDYDAQQADFDKIAAYMIAAAASCRPYRLGVYGSYSVIEEMARREIGEAYWQCVAWSGGQVSDKLDIYQKEWNVKTPVTRVDNNYAQTLDGLWKRGDDSVLYKFSPAEMGIYHNAKKRSITAIKKELGCDVICNLNLFNPNWTGACYTKADGKVVGTDGYGYYGFGFDRSDKTLTRGWSGQDTHANFFGCWDLITSSEVDHSAAPSWTTGWRRRTVIGTCADGLCFIYCNPTVETIPDLTAKLEAAGATEAIVLDGGGSTQCITPGGTVVSSDKTPRAVHTLFWANLKVKVPACPYTEPTSNIRKGSIGSGAKWVQWQLNRKGANPALAVDGIFGGKSAAALKVFQAKHNLEPDGICGKLTRAKLKE